MPIEQEPIEVLVVVRRKGHDKDDLVVVLHEADFALEYKEPGYDDMTTVAALQNAFKTGEYRASIRAKTLTYYDREQMKKGVQP